MKWNTRRKKEEKKKDASRSHVERPDTLWWNCLVLFCFFFPQKFETEPSEECRGNTSHSVPHYHLMSLLAHAFNVTTPGINHRKMQTNSPVSGELHAVN